MIIFCFKLKLKFLLETNEKTKKEKEIQDLNERIKQFEDDQSKIEKLIFIFNF